MQFKTITFKNWCERRAESTKARRFSWSCNTCAILRAWLVVFQQHPCRKHKVVRFFVEKILMFLLFAVFNKADDVLVMLLGVIAPKPSVLNKGTAEAKEILRTLFDSAHRYVSKRFTHSAASSCACLDCLGCQCKQCREEEDDEAEIEQEQAEAETEQSEQAEEESTAEVSVYVCAVLIVCVFSSPKQPSVLSAANT